MVNHVGYVVKGQNCVHNLSEFGMQKERDQSGIFRLDGTKINRKNEASF